MKAFVEVVPLEKPNRATRLCTLDLEDSHGRQLLSVLQQGSRAEKEANEEAWKALKFKENRLAVGLPHLPAKGEEKEDNNEEEHAAGSLKREKNPVDVDEADEAPRKRQRTAEEDTAKTTEEKEEEKSTVAMEMEEEEKSVKIENGSADKEDNEKQEKGREKDDDFGASLLARMSGESVMVKDEAVLHHLEIRKEQVEVELLKLYEKQVLFKRGVAFAARAALVEGTELEVAVPDMLTSPTLKGSR
jgi:hypothetical protein